MGFQATVLDRALQQELSSEETLEFYIIEHLFAKSFRMSKQGKPLLSAHYLQLAEKLLNVVEVNSKLRAWLLSAYYPKKSYFLFKGKNPQGAASLVEANIVLLRNFIGEGHHFFAFALLQQTHNLARIFLAKQDKVKALAIIQANLLFLLNGLDTSPYLTGVTLAGFQKQYPAECDTLRDLFQNQLLNETLGAILKEENTDSLLGSLSLIFTPLESALEGYSPATGPARVTKHLMKLFTRLANTQHSDEFVREAVRLKKEQKELTKAQDAVLSRYIRFFHTHNRIHLANG